MITVLLHTDRCYFYFVIYLNELGMIKINACWYQISAQISVRERVFFCEMCDGEQKVQRNIRCEMFLSLQLLAERVALYLDVEVCNHILDQVSLFSGLFLTVLGSYILVLTVTNSETNFQTKLSFILLSSFC